MKILKKIGLGLFLIALAVSIFQLAHKQHTSAAGFPIPPRPANVDYTRTEYWQACAYKAAFNASGGVLDICITDLSSNGANTFNYANDFTLGSTTLDQDFQSGNFQTKYGPTPPQSITLLNSSDSPLVKSSTPAETLAWNTLAYTGQSFIAGSAPQTQEVKFYVYQPGPAAKNATNYSFLASMNSDGTMQVLTLVYNVISNHKVFSVPINRTAVDSTPTGAPVTSGQVKKGDSCSGGADCSNGVCQKTGGDCTAVQATCASSSFTSFEWIFCPVLDLFDKMVNTFTNILENLLDFNVSQYLNAQVKSSWSIMKTISSAILVVIMLIAVIAQAVGGGPIDAYTLRKILPRLVVAVILIQISWIMLVWFIQLADDLGHGVRDLISAPFGGWVNLDLQHLIAPLGGKGTLTVAALFTGIITATIFSGLTIAGVGFLGLSAVLSDLLAFVFLVLRQIFVVMGVILFPIAMIAWILPGTQRYWKLWADNFIKLLLLFPMIMALIYGGRIFAHVFIAANANSIIGVFVLFIGFFGPYWFIPKAFRWGGQLYAAASTGAFNATKGIREFPRKYALSNAQQNRQFRAEQRNIRLGENASRFPRWDRLLSGRYNLALTRQNREHHFNANRAAGRKASEEAAVASITGGAYEGLDHPYKLDSLRTVAQGHFDQRTGMDGRNAALQRWALDQLAAFGDWDIISNLRDSGSIDPRTWQMFVAKNISGIHQNAPHLSPQRTDLSQLGYEEYGVWKDLELRELRRQYEGGQVRDIQTGQLVDSADPTALRLRILTKARQALADDQVRRRMTAEGIADLESIVRQSDLVETPTAHVTQASRGVDAQVFLPTDLGTAEAHASLNTALSSGAGRDDRGRIVLSNQAREVSRNLADRVADANPATPQGQADERNFNLYVEELRNQAATSPTARTIHNQLVRDFHQRLEQRARQAEQQAFAVGHGPGDIDREVTEELRHGSEKIDRLNLHEI